MNRILSHISSAFRAFNPRKSSKDMWSEARGFGSEGLVTANKDEALKLSAYFCGIRILSEIPASLPICIYETKEGNREQIHNHFISKLLKRPSPWMNGYNFFEFMFASLHMRGNAIAVIQADKQTGITKALVPIVPSSVSNLEFIDGQLVYTINDTTTGISGKFLGSEVIHVKLFSGTGFWGRDPLTYAKENLGLGLAAERFGNRFFAKDGNLKAVMEMDKSFPSDTAFKDFRKRFKSYKDHETPILEYGLKYRQLSIAPEQAQFISSREFSIQDIARWLNLPPHMLKDLSRATFSNIEHQDIQFVKYSLRSVLKNFEEELDRKLIFESNQGKIKIKFNVDGIQRGDMKTRAQYLHTMVTDGILTPNEARVIENRPKLSGLDKPLTPAHIIGKQQDNNNKKKEDE